MVRSARAARNAPVPVPTYIRRRLAWFDPLDEEQLVRLDAQVDWIMQDAGIAFRDDPEALATWKSAGAKIGGDIVRAPADWVRAECSKAPRQFTQLVRNPEKSVVIGGDAQVLPQSMVHRLCGIWSVGGVMAIWTVSGTSCGCPTCTLTCTTLGW